MGTVKMDLNKAGVAKDGQYPIIFIVRDKKTRRIQKSGVKTLLDQWDDKTKNVIPRKHPGGKVTQVRLAKKLLALKERMMLGELDGLYGKTLVDYTLTDPNNSQVYLYSFIETIIDENTTSGRVGNSQVYLGLLNQLQKIDKQDFLIQKVTYSFIKDFILKKQIDGVSNNTIHHYLRTLRAVINEAIRREIFDANKYPFKKGIMPALDQTRNRNLKETDIQTIENSSLHGVKEFAKDIFLLGFYFRGMDLVDLLHLTKENLIDERLVYKRKKTGTLLSVNIHSKAKKLLNKYKNEGLFLIPALTMTMDDNHTRYISKRRQLNRALNQIGKSLELDKPLTTKVNRHTWATIAKTKGVEIDIISEALGHSTRGRMVTGTYLDKYDDSVIDQANDLVCGIKSQTK